MSPRRRDRPQDLELTIRAEVMERVKTGRAFKPLDIQAAIESKVGEAPLAVVSRVVQRLFDEGLLRPFGYRRTLSQERTRYGVVTLVLYAPPHPTTRSGPPRASSKAPTRAPVGRPFGYLPLTKANERRLDRQTDALRRQLQATGSELVRVGELLLAVKAVVGSSGLRHYLDREFGMSQATARRHIRVAEVFGHHRELGALSVAKPSVLYKLAEPSFPSELREAIIRAGGIVVDGELRRFEKIRVGDVRLSKAQYLERQEAIRKMHRSLAELEHQPESVEEEKLRVRIRELEARPAAQVTTAAVSKAELKALSGLSAEAERLAGLSHLGQIEGDTKKQSIDALRRLLWRLEG